MLERRREAITLIAGAANAIVRLRTETGPPRCCLAHYARDVVQVTQDIVTVLTYGDARQVLACADTIQASVMRSVRSGRDARELLRPDWLCNMYMRRVLIDCARAELV